MPVENILCAICGVNPASTSDHLPPKGIFAKPRPSDLITVPACYACNSGASRYDEAFRAYLSLHVGTETPASLSLWEKHALRTINHNRRIKRNLLSTMRPVELRSPSGVIYGKAVASLWDSEAHDKVIERMIRGLYFHHYGGILGVGATIKVHWLRQLPKKIASESESWAHNSVAEGKFVYRFSRADESPLHSIWLFQFYDRHWASGYTSPVSSGQPV